MKAKLAALWACLVLAACVGPLTKEQNDRIHSVAVISLIGDQVTLDQVALLFGGVHEKVPVDAGFDALAEDTAMACGKGQGAPRTMQRIDIPKKPLIDKLNGGVLAAYNATMSLIRPEIAAWVAQNPVDAIIIIHEVNNQIPGGPSQYFAGLGLHQFLDRAPHVQGSFGLAIWDGKTLSEITDLSTIPDYGAYQYSIDDVRRLLLEGRHVTTLENELKLMIRSGVCRMLEMAKF